MCDTQKTNRDSKHGVKIFLNNLFYNWWALSIAAVVWFAAMRADSREVADSCVEFFELMFCIECLIHDEKNLHRKCDAFWSPWPL